jgi:Fungal Zn(2)-Cys(6) binuclear cluster domain
VHKSSPTSSGAKIFSLNPRSCVTCRKRKVKCDKKHPCSNCSRAHIDCIFPAPGRAPRKPRKPQDPDLAERLRRLESLVQSLGTQEDESPKDTTDAGTTDAEGVKEEETNDQKIARVKKEWKSLMKARAEDEEKNGTPDVDNLTNRFGALISGEGRSRYITPGLWASLNAAVGVVSIPWRS